MTGRLWGAGYRRTILHTVVSVAIAATGGAFPISADAQETDVNAILRTGVQQFEQGNLEQALETFESVLALEPENATAIYEIALTQMQLGDPERALAVLNDALERNLDEGAEYYALAASILDNTGRSQEALALFEEGIASYPDSHSLYLNLGVTQLKLQQLAEARATFERAADLQPGHPSAHFYLGQIYASAGETAPAILALAAALAQDNNPQRMAASAAMIRDLMRATVQFSDSGQPIVVLPPDALLDTKTMAQLSSGVPMHVATGIVLQSKAGGDMEYEPYAVAFGLLITAFVQAEMDPAAHFAAQYSRFYGPIVENGHQQAFAHVMLAPLSPAAAIAWMSTNEGSLTAYSDWTRSRGNSN